LEATFGTLQEGMRSMTRKADEIDALEKQVAESLVDQVRDDLLRWCGQEPRPDSNPDGEFNWDDLAWVAAEMRQASAEPEWDAQSRAELTSFIARLEFALKIKRTRKGAWRRTRSRPHSANAPALEAFKQTKSRPRKIPPMPQQPKAFRDEN
jgi:hypothetical protein